MEWVLVVAVLVAAWLVAVYIAWRNHRRSVSKESPDDAQIPHLDGGGRYAFEIVGESFRQSALKRIAGPKDEDSKDHPCTATLVLEDDNAYDDMAVRVDIEGRTVGYLSRARARSYRKWLTSQGIKGDRTTVDAVIVGGWDRGGDDVGSYGVKLDLSLRKKRSRSPKG